VTPTRLTLGTVQLGMRYGVANRTGMPSAEDARAILERALELGVRSFDTAPAYGEAEERVGAALRGRDVFLTSKLPALAKSGVPAAELSRVITRAVESSLARLGKIDVYLLHDAGDLRSYGARLSDALAAEVAAGRIGRAGASVYGPDDAALLLDHPALSAIQFPLSLLDQRMLPLLPRLRARGVQSFARSAFLQGLYAFPRGRAPRRLTMVHDWLDQLHALTAEHGTTPLAAALPFVADVEQLDSVVIGVDTIAQLEANVTEFGRPLPGGAALAAALRERFAELPAEAIDPSRWPPEPAEVRPS